MIITKDTYCGKKEADGYSRLKAWSNEVYQSLQIGHHRPTLEQLNAKGWMVYVDTVPDLSIEKLAPDFSDNGSIISKDRVGLASEDITNLAKSNQRIIIEQAYCAAECTNLEVNVTGIGYIYPGGYAAAQIRDDALSLLIRGKLRGWLPEDEKTTFYDVNGSPVSLTEDEADQVVLRTAFKFEEEHTKMRLYLKAINDAVTVEEVRAVVWE